MMHSRINCESNCEKRGRKQKWDQGRRKEKGVNCLRASESWKWELAQGWKSFDWDWRVDQREAYAFNCAIIEWISNGNGEYSWKRQIRRVEKTGFSRSRIELNTIYSWEERRKEISLYGGRRRSRKYRTEMMLTSLMEEETNVHYGTLHYDHDLHFTRNFNLPNELEKQSERIEWGKGCYNWWNRFDYGNFILVRIEVYFKEWNVCMFVLQLLSTFWYFEWICTYH